MKKIQGIIIIIALLVGFYPTFAAQAGTTTILPLMAGQFTQVGTVTVSDDGVTLTVKYDITSTGWYMTDTHLYVNTTAPKNSAPGLFTYKHTELLNVTTDTYTIPITIGTQYYIAAHAVVVNNASGQIVGWQCPTLDETAAMLPASGTIRVNNKYNPYAYWDVIISSSSFLNGTYPGWCIDQTHHMFWGHLYQGNFYSSYGTIPSYLTSGEDPYIDHPENLDLVNWVVNNHDGYTVYEVQDVIWHLIDANPYEPLTANEQILYDAALTHEGFVPDFASGDVFTVIVSPIADYPDLTPYAQSLLVEVGMECTPIYQYQADTAWAQGNLFWKTGWGSYFTYTP